MSKERSSEPKFKNLISSKGGFSRTKAIIISSPDDSDASKIHKSSVNFYEKENKCKVINKKNMIPFSEDIDTESKGFAELKKCKKNEEILLVFSSHGNLHWLMGDLPGKEEAPLSNFANFIKTIEKDYSVRIQNVVLDACYSAVELKNPRLLTEGTSNNSPARILSLVLGEGYNVFGLNGMASDGKVKYLTIDGSSKEYASYFKNVVIFSNGEVTKHSQHKNLGQGLTHSTDIISSIGMEEIEASIKARVSNGELPKEEYNKALEKIINEQYRPHYNEIFGRAGDQAGDQDCNSSKITPPPFYRSDSFSTEVKNQESKEDKLTKNESISRV